MKKIFTEYLKICLFTLFLVLGGMSSLYAANRYAVANGNWNSTSTWSATSGGGSGASAPGAGDNVYIERGYTVTVTANASCTNLYFSTATTGNLGTLSVNTGVTLAVSGEVTLENAPSEDVSANISGAGTLSCANLNIGNNTNPSSSLGITVAHTLTSTITQLNISQNLTIKSRYTLFFFFFYNYCNGIFIQNSGTVTVNGSVATNNENSGNSSTLTLGNSSPTLNIAGSTPFNLSGTGTNTITLNGTGATVNYSGAAQQIRATTYSNLTLSGTEAKTFPSGTTTVNNVLSIENGTSANTFTGTLAYGAAATLQYNAGSSNRTVAAEWPATFNGTGGVIIKGTGTITLNGAKTLGVNVPLNINTGGKLTTNNNALTFGGDFINNGTFTSGSSNITITNTAASQSIAGFTTTGNVSMTKTSGTATFTGNVSAAGFSLNGTGGTLSFGTGLTHTFTGTFNITAGTLQGGSSTIKINGTPGTLTGSWEEGTSTVDYGGASQIIFATTYYNLVFSSGTKSLSASANISIKGNFTNNATFTYGTSTVTFNGTSPQTIGGSKATTFYNLTINNTGTSGNNTVTLEQPTTVTNTLTLTSGIVNMTSTNVLSVTNTATSGISGGSASTFVNGPLKWYLPANLAAGTSYIFPVGAGNNYYPFTLVNPTTGATAPTVQIEAKAGSGGGTFDGTLFSLSTTEYWNMTTTGSFTNSSISISRPTAITPYNVIAGSTAVNGTYTSLGGTAGTNGVTNSNSIGSNRYFALGRARYLTLSTTSLTGFTYPEGNGPSGIQSFTVNADGLTDNVIITSPTDFEVSLSGGTSFSGSSQITIPIVSGGVNNVSVYVRMKAGLSQGSIGPEQLTVASTGFTNQTINLSGTVTVRPVVTLSTSGLSGFTYSFSAGPSAQQSFTVSGSNLSGNVTLTAPVHYEISTTSGSGFTSSISLTPTGGTLPSTTIYVRLKVSLGVGTYNETLTAASQYAVTKNLSLNGSVTSAATLTTTPAWLACFIYTSGSGPSGAQTFSLTGSNLGTNTVTVTAPTNFEISSNGTTFSSSFTLTPSGGAVNQTVYARLKSGLAVGTYGPSNVSLSCTGAVTKTVALNGQLVNTATVLVSKNTVTGFGYQLNGGPSPVQSLTVSGASLGTNNIVVTPPSNYEISTSPNSGFQSTAITLIQSSGKVDPTNIYIRLKSGLTAGTYNQTLTVVSGSITQNVTLNGKVYATPLITASGGGDYCSGSTINLTSTGDDIVNRYWSGPNNYYSTSQNPSIANSTPSMSGTYSVTGNVITGGNLIVNGDFEMGNVAISSSYGYPAEPFTTSSLVPEGLYAIVNLPSTVHSNFTSTGVDHTTGTGKQMVINGATNPGVVVWSQSVAVVANADYEFTYWVQTVVNGNDQNPSQLQLYVNGVAAGPIYTANPTTAVWTQFIYNTNAGSNTVLNLELVNQNTIAGGNDFALDDIVFHQILPATASTNVTVNNNLPVSVSISYSPSVVYTNTPVIFTATPTNGGSAPLYEWSVNGTVVGTNSSTYTYTPQNGDVVSCKLTSSYPCATGNPATSSKTMTVLTQNNYWMGAVSSTDWATASNWTAGFVPLAGDNVEYATVANYGTAAVNDLQLDADRTISSLINATNKKLIIPAAKALTVNNTITISDSQNANLILIKSGGSSTPQGTLIFHNDADHPVYGTVEMYSKAWIDPNGATNNKYFWQYFGLPFRSLQANPSFYGAYVRKWDETGTTISNHWVQLGNNDVIQSFLGYEICQPSEKTYTWQGILENRDFSSGELAYTSSALYPGQHIFGNSYTAAIDITQINFGNNMEATVYLYNTGSFNNWGTNNGETSNSPTNTNPGTYAAIPQNQAGQGGVQGQIPSMQGFLVKAMSNTTGNTLSIPYSSVAVKNTTLQRAKAANENSSDEKQYLRIDLKTDTVIVDRMWIFNEENCTRSFDNGWDGPKMLTENGTPALCAIEKDGLYQVNSVNNMDETKLGFRKGTATQYTLTFYPKNLQQRYPAVYLLDEATNKAIKIENEETAYTFTATGAGNLQQRFRIVARYYDKGETEGETQIKVFSSKSHIVIDNLSTENGEALIYDISGRKIAQEKFSGESITVYGNYPTGAYVVKAFTNKGTVTERIIVR
ncbi:MAG: T9SS type A sorting domain-containing protein [Bacteroidales bacterium]|nr:T9SS type A sorting domain-containing protein [Bacteroidales bacterium]